MNKVKIIFQFILFLILLQVCVYIFVIKTNLYSKNDQNVPEETWKQRIQDNNYSDVSLKLGRNDRYNWNYTGQLHRDYRQFAPAMNMIEYMWYIDLIVTFKRACETYNITYMLYAGSVLGAYRYHGFVPWDDDFDCIVNVSEKHILLKALVDIPGYTLYSPNNYQWKFFSDSRALIGSYMWSWPFIDIFFFTVNETHFYEVTHEKQEFVGPISDILPIEKGIFENIIMPVPHNMEAVLNKRYNMTDPCESKWWDHKTETLPELETTRIPCHKLFGVYPVVQRFDTDNTSFEALTLGNRVLYSIERQSMQL